MIREAVLRDVPAILEVYAPYIQNSVYTFEYEVPSLEDFTERFVTTTEQHPWLVWEEDGEIFGYAYAHKPFARAAYQWDAELAVYLRQDCRGRGIGRALCEALEEIIYRQGYFVMYSIVTSSNEGSRRFHEALGYRQVAELPASGWKFGKWHGIIWYEKRLRDGEPETPPVSWRQL